MFVCFGIHDSFLAAKSNGACSSRQIHSNSPQTYTESGQDGGKKIPLYVFCLMRIFRRCLDGGGGGGGNKYKAKHNQP